MSCAAMCGMLGRQEQMDDFTRTYSVKHTLPGQTTTEILHGTSHFQVFMMKYEIYGCPKIGNTLF